MAKKLDIGLMGSVLVGAFMMAVPSVTWSVEGNRADDTSQMIQRMESHWQTLIRERDPIQRKAMIVVHRKMMGEARAAQGANQNHPMGDHHGQDGMMDAHHQHDLQNTTDMHSMMLDMMK